MPLLQVVPSLPPAVNGVGDYATILARQLWERHGVESSFVVGDPAWVPPPGGAEFPTRAVPARTAGSLGEALAAVPASGTILLHYVPYGYAPRGCPFWLADALRDLRRRRPDLRLITVFHELSADGERPWKSAYWLSPIQRRLGRRIGRLSGVRRMTTTRVAEQLRGMLAPDDQGVETVPVFSNLGEPASLLPTGQRQRRMVVFGTRTWREEVYRRHLDGLLAACRHLGVESILDVGSPLTSLPTGLPLPLAVHGLLRTEDSPEVFGRSLAGFFTYPAAWLGKSGIFAAYCAHGLVPVTIPGNDEPSLEGLQPGVHYLVNGQGDAPEEVGRAAHAWYRQHCAAVHADGIHRAMLAAR